MAYEWSERKLAKVVLMTIFAGFFYFRSSS